MSSSTRTSARDDRGAVLILTLVLTIVLAAVVVAIASFVAVGLRTSKVTDNRNETNADGAAAITWAMESFRTGTLGLGDCSPTGAPVLVPAEIAVNGSSILLECQTTTEVGTFPVVYLRATADNGSTSRIVQAVAQFSPGEAVRALDWKVDDADLVGP